MRTSLDKIKEIEDFLLGKKSPEDSVLFQAKVLLDPLLKREVMQLKKVYSLIQQFGRKKIKSELSEVENQLFHDPQHRLFQKQVSEIFKN